MRPLGAAECAGGRSLSDPVLSPDGRAVAFVVRGPEGSALMVAAVPGGGEGVVARDPEPAGRGGAVAWLSHDRLAYLTRDALVVVGADGGPVTVLVEGIEGGAGGLVASPDGRRLAYVSDTRAVTVVQVAGGAAEIVSSEADFALDPAWSSDGALLAWHEWDVPAMPWDESRIVVAPARAGGGRERLVVMGGPGVPVAVQEPRFAPDGSALAFMSDADGWANVWVARAAAAGSSGSWSQNGPPRPVVDEQREHAGPAWGPGARSFAWSPDSSAVAFCRNVGGFGQLCVAEVATGEVRELTRGIHTSLSWAGGRIACVRSGARTPTAVVTVDAVSGGIRTVATGPGAELASVAGLLPEPEVVEWEAPDGAVVRGRLWRPAAGASGAAELPDPAGVSRAAERQAPLPGTSTAESASLPPLLVWAHGGPTDQRRVTFDARLAFFVSRGWAVLHPDCRGSTGWGRAWAQGLRGGWGDVDVADVAAGARAAVARGWADPARLVAMGGSAGGMTALLLAARHPDLWAAAVALYPVADLEGLPTATHRFEAHYTVGLVGPLPETVERHRARSPLHLAGRITAPVLLLHGSADEVVPAGQSRQLAALLRERGVAVEHHEYEDEGHGWRSPATVQDELERTEAFLARHVRG